ncbi:MAG: transketolase [Thaumarchaeota archaeon]|nr:transketolase [Nitrososphaerota archaeon]
MQVTVDQAKIEKLKSMCKKIRIDIIKMLAEAGSGHPGGSLSSVEILVGLFFYKMRHDPKNPKWEDRDRFVLSKGHGVPALYATLAEAGYFPLEELMTLRKYGSRLQGHSDSVTAPFIEVSTGSLGQGLSLANGMGLAARLQGKKWRTYVVLGDGELEEGQVWEASSTASYYKIDNVTAIVDRNFLQQNGPTEQLKSMEPIADKFRAFGFHVIEINGHDVAQVVRALDEAETIRGKPAIIIAKTVKGKGVSFMENVPGFHGKAPTKEQAVQALKELEA